MTTAQSCTKNRLAVQDTLDVINGKWKLVILLTLQNRSFRFRELGREIGITPRMLSKELQDLEANHLVSRSVLATKPMSVEYAITDYGLSFGEVLEALRNWGLTHRRRHMDAQPETR